eukprot:TRINITY_DN22831_c0_g1_i1.p1 TRINITY_DN22831_c0_g1~~TRINITY_DN22831_c0_g1_i1.p1  ORF type:complete len:2622 (-),score=470.03 TRINITY_DN22831_c0_g1_i1:58-7023(-)
MLAGMFIIAMPFAIVGTNFAEAVAVCEDPEQYSKQLERSKEVQGIARRLASESDTLMVSSLSTGSALNPVQVESSIEAATLHRRLRSLQEKLQKSRALKQQILEVTQLRDNLCTSIEHAMAQLTYSGLLSFEADALVEPPLPPGVCRNSVKLDRKKSKILCEWSCYVLHRESRLRQWFIKLTSFWFFDWCVIAAIIANSVILCMQEYYPGDKVTGGYVAEHVFTALFTVECIAKVIANGFAFSNNTYLRDGWNVIDFIVVLNGVAFWTAYAFKTDISFLRTVRVLRPLRTLSALPGMRKLVNTIVLSMPGLKDVVILSLFLLTTFGILGTFIWGGIMHRLCRVTTQPLQFVPQAGMAAGRCLTEFCFENGSGIVAVGGNYVDPTDVFTAFCAPVAACAQSVAAGGDYLLWPMERTQDRFCGGYQCKSFSFDEAAANWKFGLPISELVEKVLRPLGAVTSDGQLSTTCGSSLADDKLYSPSQFNVSLQGINLNDWQEEVVSETFNWGLTNYDQIGSASLVVFQVVTMEGWVDIMYMLQDASSTVAAFTYFLFLVVIGSFFLLNVTLAIVWDAFAAIQNKDAEAEAREHEAARAAQAAQKEKEEKEAVKDDAQDAFNLIVSTKDVGFQRSASIRRTVSSFVSKHRHAGIEGILETPHYLGIVTVCRSIANSYLWNGFIMLIIALNVVVLSTDSYPKPALPVNVQEAFSLTFSLIFFIEFVVLHIALGPFAYWFQPTLAFDGIIVIFALPDWYHFLTSSSGSSGSGVTALRAFRLLRIFKLMKKLHSMKCILKAVLETILGMREFVMLLLLIVFVFALVGQSIFAGKFMFDDDGRALRPQTVSEFRAVCPFAEEPFRDGKRPDCTPRAHFDTFLWSCITIFQILTGENWNTVMYDGMRAAGWVSLSFFVLVIIFGQFVILNLFLAILMMNFEYNHNIVRDVEKERRHRKQQQRMAALNAVASHMKSKVQDKCHRTDSQLDGTPGSGSPARSKRKSIFQGGGMRGMPSISGMNWMRASPRSPSSGTQSDASDEALKNRSPNSGEAQVGPVATDMRVENVSDSSNQVVSDNAATGARVADSTAAELPESPPRPHTAPERVAGSVLTNSPTMDARAEKKHLAMNMTGGGDNPLPVGITSTCSPNSSIPRGIAPPSGSGQSDNSIEIVDNSTGGTCIPGRIRAAGSSIEEMEGREGSKDDVPSSTRPYDYDDNEPHFASPNRAFKEFGTDGRYSPEDSDEENDEEEDEESEGGAFEEAVDEVMKIVPIDLKRRVTGILQADSLRCWLLHAIRAKCKALSSQWWFDRGILSCIIVSSALMWGQNPLYDPEGLDQKILTYANFFFTVIFTLEMLIKICAHGLIIRPNAYFRSFWNVMDAAIVTVSLMDTLQQIFSPNATGGILSVVQVFRICRVLRPLRIISRNDNLKVVVRTILSSIPELRSLVVFSSLFFLIFGLFGVSMFKGSFYRCLDGQLEPKTDFLIPSLDNPGVSQVCIPMNPGGVVGTVDSMKFIARANLSEGAASLCPPIADGAGAGGWEQWSRPESSTPICEVHCDGTHSAKHPFCTTTSPWGYRVMRCTDCRDEFCSRDAELEASCLKDCQDHLWFCKDNDPLCLEQCVATCSCDSECVGLALDAAVCLENAGRWVNLNQNFDNLGTAMISLFEVSTTEGWVDLMLAGVDARGPMLQPRRDHNELGSLLFVAFILVGSFFVLNLCVGVIIDNYHKQKIHRRPIWESEEQEKWVVFQKALYAKRLFFPQTNLHLLSPTRQHLVRIVSAPLFDHFIMCCIFMNTFVLGMNWHPVPNDSYTQAITTMNHLFAIAFNAEAVVKICAFRWNYFREPWNQFDFLIVFVSDIFSLIERLTEFDNTFSAMIGAFKVFRIARLFRLVRFLKGLNQLFFAFVLSLPKLFNVACIMFLLIYLYAVLGLNIFAKVVQNSVYNDSANFTTFFNAMSLLVRSMTGEGWNEIMHSLGKSRFDLESYMDIPCSESFDITPGNFAYYDLLDGVRDGVISKPFECGNAAFSRIFFISYTVIVTFMILNLFIAVIFEGFEESSKSEVVEIITKCQEVWHRYDPNYEMLIPLDRALDFIDEVVESLQRHHKRSNAQHVYSDARWDSNYAGKVAPQHYMAMFNMWYIRYNAIVLGRYDNRVRFVVAVKAVARRIICRGGLGGVPAGRSERTACSKALEELDMRYMSGIPPNKELARLRKDELSQARLINRALGTNINPTPTHFSDVAEESEEEADEPRFRRFQSTITRTLSLGLTRQESDSITSISPSKTNWEYETPLLQKVAAAKIQCRFKEAQERWRAKETLHSKNLRRAPLPARAAG